jgi:hypothetical protein
MSGKQLTAGPSTDDRVRAILHQLQKSCSVDVHMQYYSSLISLFRDRTEPIFVQDVSIMDQLAAIVCFDLIMETSPSQLYLLGLTVFSWIYSHVWVGADVTAACVASESDPHMRAVAAKIVNHLTWPLSDKDDFTLAVMKLSLLFIGSFRHCTRFFLIHWEDVVINVVNICQQLSEDLQRAATLISLDPRDKWLLRGLAVDAILHMCETCQEQMFASRLVARWLNPLITVAVDVTVATTSDIRDIQPSSSLNELMSSKYGTQCVSFKLSQIIGKAVTFLTTDFERLCSVSFMVSKLHNLIEDASKLLTRYVLKYQAHSQISVCNLILQLKRIR